MNGVEARLMELVQMAETPLYSAYRWLGRALGHEIALDAFIHIVQGLLDRDVMRLWVIDPARERRVRLERIPSDLDTKYRELGHQDETYDPLSLSLTVGQAADGAILPDWDVDLDFSAGTFSLRARAGVAEEALRQLGMLFPTVRFLPMERHGLEDQAIGISGTLASAGEPDWRRS